MFKNGFFEAVKVRLVFDMGRHHVPERRLVDTDKDLPPSLSRLNRGQTRYN